MNVVLRYVGRGEFIPGVPARDLEEGDMEAVLKELKLNRNELVRSGLYVPVNRKADKGPGENKSLVPSVENKDSGG